MKKIFIFLELVLVTVFLSLLALPVSFFDRDGRVLHRMARLWARIHMRACGIEALVKGREHITKPPYILMCNHQSALDIFSLLTALPLQFKWIAKRELFRIPFLGWAMKRAGYISLDRKHPREALRAMEDAAQKIRGGTTIVIFPEGTRSADGSLLPFKKGGFSLAMKAGVPIVPVAISGSRSLQPKGSFIPSGKGVIYIGIGRPIETSRESRSGKADIMMKVREAIEGMLSQQMVTLETGRTRVEA